MARMSISQTGISTQWFLWCNQTVADLHLKSDATKLNEPLLAPEGVSHDAFPESSKVDSRLD